MHARRIVVERAAETTVAGRATTGSDLTELLAAVIEKEKKTKKIEPQHVDLPAYMSRAGLLDAPPTLWPKSQVCDEVETERAKLRELGCGQKIFVYTDLRRLVLVCLIATSSCIRFFIRGFCRRGCWRKTEGITKCRLSSLPPPIPGGHFSRMR